MDRATWPAWVRITLIGVRTRSLATALAVSCFLLGTAFPLIVAAFGTRFAPVLVATAAMFALASLGAVLYMVASRFLPEPLG